MASLRDATLTSAPPSDTARRIHGILRKLEQRYGAETWHWSPDYVRGPIDILAGAVLVQHTAWPNAERALEALRDADALDTRRLAAMPLDDIAALIRISGTPSVKAHRLQALARTVEDAGGMNPFLALPAHDLRVRLLATHGIGPETADAIALYAANARVFVVDAYTVRIFERIGLAPDGGRSYQAWQRFFEQALPADGAEAFQRHHAHIVLHGKAACRARPRCRGCLLIDDCATGRLLIGGAGAPP